MSAGDRIAAAAQLVVSLARRRPATLGNRRLVCVDGPAGSGKTTLGAALADSARWHGSARVLHLDDMYEGWSGLGTVAVRVERDLLGPLQAGRAGRYWRYDWHRERFTEQVPVEPVDLLVLEGVGSVSESYRPLVTVSVWVEAPRALRLQRGLERDGPALLPRWLDWMRDEDAEFDRQRTREQADVVVDGTGVRAARLVDERLNRRA